MDEDNVAVDEVAHRIETDYFSVYEEVSNIFADGRVNNLARLEDLGDRLDQLLQRAYRVSKRHRTISLNDLTDPVSPVLRCCRMGVTRTERHPYAAVSLANL